MCISKVDTKDVNTPHNIRKLTMSMILKIGLAYKGTQSFVVGAEIFTFQRTQLFIFTINNTYIVGCDTPPSACCK